MINKKHLFNNTKTNEDYDQQNERLRKRKCFADKELEEITPEHHRLIRETYFEASENFQNQSFLENELPHRYYDKNVLFSLDQTLMLQYCSALFAHFVNEQQTNLVKSMAVGTISCSDYNSLPQVSIMKEKNSRVNNFSVDSLVSYGD